MVAISHVSPSFSVMRININRGTKDINCLLPLLKLHMCTSTSKLLFGIKHIDSECFLVALNRLLIVVFVEVVSCQGAHRSCTFLVAYVPRFLIHCHITLHIAENAQHISVLKCVTAVRFLKFLDYFLSAFDCVGLPARNGETFHCFFVELNVDQQFVG